MPKKRYLIIGILLVIAITSLYLGSTPPSPLYYLKIARETVQTFFIFGDEDKANWLLTRAEKRIAEAEKLRSKKLDSLAQMQVDTAKTYQSEAEIILQDLSNKTNITYLRDKYNQNQDRLKLLGN